MNRDPKCLTQERLKSLLDYDAETGHFIWKCQKKAAKPGQVAGGVADHGYVRIRIDGVRYRAHRLVWLWVFGRFPTDELDHVNGDPADNRLSNLREATHAQNMQNRRTHANNTSGFPGVALIARTGKWRARIRARGKKVNLGSFDTCAAASEAYLRAKAELHAFQPVPGARAAA